MIKSHPVQPTYMQPLLLALIAMTMIAAASVQCRAYWPGIMTWDAINQYGQAVDGVYDDWHPPVMAWLWRQLNVIKSGPTPMYVLQLGLYWLGYGLIVAAALRRKQTVAAIIVTAVALMPFPLAIMGSVLKDCLMEGALLAATGVFILSGPERSWAARIPAILLLVFAGLLRFNAFLATLPLLVALLPLAWRRTPLRTTAITLPILAALLVSVPIASRLIGADKSDVQLSLVIFDLGGITKITGADIFPPLPVAKPVAVNARCYRPDKWDSYSSWATPLCPINFVQINGVISDSGEKPISLLARAIFAHPIAYAEHRLDHFNINARFLVHDEVQGPAPDRAVDNQWGFVVPSNTELLLINRVTDWSIHSPLGWPIWWIALAAGLLTLCPRLSSRWLIAPLALSALLYGLGYLPFSVSSELRYHLWTITGTAIAAAFAVADLMQGAQVPKRRILAAVSPALIVCVLCLLWRLG